MLDFLIMFYMLTLLYNRNRNTLRHTLHRFLSASFNIHLNERRENLTCGLKADFNFSWVFVPTFLLYFCSNLLNLFTLQIFDLMFSFFGQKLVFDLQCFLICWIPPSHWFDILFDHVSIWSWPFYFVFWPTALFRSLQLLRNNLL